MAFDHHGLDTRNVSDQSVYACEINEREIGEVGCNIHEYIKIAVGARLPSHPRTEQGEVDDTLGPQAIRVCLDPADDLIVLHASKVSAHSLTVKTFNQCVVRNGSIASVTRCL